MCDRRELQQSLALFSCLTVFAPVGCVTSGDSGSDHVSEEVQAGDHSSGTSGSTAAIPSTLGTAAGTSATPNGTSSASSSSSTPTVTSTGPATSTENTNPAASSSQAQSSSSAADEDSTNTTPSDEGSGSMTDAGLGESAEPNVDAGPSTPLCPAAPALTGGQEYCSNAKGNAGNGYGYELWAEGGGTGCMTVFGTGAAFKTDWNDVEDFLARVGLDFDETRSHRQVGTIWADFAETQTGSEEGLTYIGIYGWTVEPLREFYILDDWGATKPAGVSSDGTPRDEVGTLEIDGETYDVWKKTRENKPSIKGDATFDQYFSIRRTSRHCGRISVSEHFAGWEDLGLPLGNLFEVKLLVESQFNSGSVEFSSAAVLVE